RELLSARAGERATTATWATRTGIRRASISIWFRLWRRRLAMDELFRMFTQTCGLATRLHDLEAHLRFGNDLLANQPLGEVIDTRTSVRTLERNEAGASLEVGEGLRVGVPLRCRPKPCLDWAFRIVRRGAVVEQPREAQMTGEHTAASVDVFADVAAELRRFAGTPRRVVALPFAVGHDHVVLLKSSQRAIQVVVVRRGVTDGRTRRIASGATAIQVNTR